MTRDSGISHRIDADGFLRVVLGRPERTVTLLDTGVLEELDRVLDDARRREEVRGALFSGAGPGMFIAGVDLTEVASVTDAFQAADAARFGQRVFQRIADLGRPTVCAIGGTCLGGGTELALACSFRIAASERWVRIGLPQVRLGMIPGFGGSQRLPRLVGLASALDLILTGQRLDARAAHRMGLVDRIVPWAYLEREALALLRSAVERGERSVAASLRGRRHPWRSAAWRFGPLRRFVLDRARRRAEATSRPEQYPAPHRAIEALEVALTQPLTQGLDFEARVVGELIPTRTAKNLIWLSESRSALKKDLGGIRAVPRRVRRMGVIGAGIMGAGITQLAADRGIPVRLKDLRHEALLAALRTARGVWARRIRSGGLDSRELANRIACIAPTLDHTGFRGVELVIEAVEENLETKRQVLAAAEERLAERAVYASNTSSLSITEIAAKALRPERVVGLHFFQPPDRMPLVEVVAAKHSSPEAVATAHALALRLGKVPVIVKDGPGFLVNRVLAAYLNEALHLLVEGVRVEAVDHAMLAFGMPLGPLALLDQIGLDTAARIAARLRTTLVGRTDDAGTLLENMVSSGRLGQRSGRGFYRYRNGKRTVSDDEVTTLAGSPDPRALPPETLQERMVLAMINESAICLREGVVSQPREVDLAMVIGAGFPPFRGGPLRHADEVGIPIVADRLKRLADAHGDRFLPADSLQRMVRAQAQFYG